MSTRYYAYKIWRSLSDYEKIYFQRRFGAYWACWRHPMPAEVILELNEYARCGRLQIHRSPFRIESIQGKHILTTKSNQIVADTLIDGTGGSDQIECSKSPLLQNMLAKGICSPHPCGGLRIDNLTYAVLNNKKRSGLYCLGPLAKGDLFSTNAFWFNANSAANLAHSFAVQQCMRPQVVAEA